MFTCYIICRYLRKEPVELHVFGCSVATLNEAWPAVHIHQALVVVIVDGGTEEPDVELLRTGVVHVLKETTHPKINNCVMLRCLLRRLLLTFS